MTTNLPDLSTWNRVPVGATIPKGTPYAYAYGFEWPAERIRAWAPVTIGETVVVP